MRNRALPVRAELDATLARPVTPVLDVWALDVGQGACIYIACPDGSSSVMIDCGTVKNGGATPKQVSDWINRKNSQVRQVTLLVTHGHKDHTSNFRPGRIDAAPFDRILLGGLPADHPAEFLDWARGAKSAPTYFEAADFKAADPRFACGAAIFDVLTANATEVRGVRHEESKENADSVVVRVTFVGHAIIFPGDAEAVTEESAMENAAKNGLDLTSTSLLISSHHGAESGNSNSAAWLSALKPKAGLFSANVQHEGYAHPRCNTVQAFYPHVEEARREFDLACGETDRSATSLRLNARLFGTYDNGHVRARFSAAGVSYACQVSTPACDAQLAPGEIP
jgi:beta-lactamase superfamily II metal-dependent hydrolase